jgi:hypothetical protein
MHRAVFLVMVVCEVVVLTVYAAVQAEPVQVQEHFLKHPLDPAPRVRIIFTRGMLA